MEEQQIGLLYLSLHNQLKKNVDMNKEIDRKLLFTILGKHYLIPKTLRCVVIKEMEKRHLIKCETKGNIEISPCECNFDDVDSCPLMGKIKVINYEYELSDNVNKFYQKAGLIV